MMSVSPKTPRGAAALLAFCLFISCAREKGPGAAAEAAKLEKEGRWAEAAALHRSEALRLGPAEGDQEVKRAMLAYLMADRLPDAERFGAEVLQRSPGRHEVLFYLGDGQRVLKQYPGARATLEKLLDLEPGHARGTVALAHVMFRLGEAAGALPLFERFLSLPEARGPLGELARIDLARALRRLGRNREAADRLAALLEESPLHPVALSEAAQALYVLQKLDVVRGLRERYSWLAERGHQLSSEDESKLYSTGSSSAGATARQALQAADRREFPAAIATLRALSEAEPGDALLATALSRLWLRLERPGDALAVADRALSRSPSDPGDLHRLRADALRALGKPDESRDSLRRASSGLAASGIVEPLALDGAVETHFRAGLSDLLPGGDRRGAEECFERARRLAPADWRPSYGEARLALESGDWKRAGDLLSRAREQAEREPRELRRSAAVLKGLTGDLRGAARELMDLIGKDPQDLESFEAFERVFGGRSADPGVARVLAMKRSLEERIGARAAEARSLSAKPFGECGPDYLALGKGALESGSRESALDFLLLAADLLPADTESLHRAVSALSAPGDAFLRLHLLRKVLARAEKDAAALQGLVRTYLDLDLRLDEAESLAVRLAALEPGAASASLLESVQKRRRALE